MHVFLKSIYHQNIRAKINISRSFEKLAKRLRNPAYEMQKCGETIQMCDKCGVQACEIETDEKVPKLSLSEKWGLKDQRQQELNVRTTLQVTKVSSMG